MPVIRQFSEDAMRRIGRQTKLSEGRRLAGGESQDLPRQPLWQFALGKTLETIPAGSSGAVAFYHGEKGMETPDGYTCSAYSRRVSLPGDEWVILILGLSGTSWDAISLNAGKSSNDGIDADPRDCVYPGADISADCTICTCSADPFVINPGPITCGDMTLDEALALFFNGEDGDTDTCVWESGTVTIGYTTFQWKLTVSEDAYGNISGMLQLLEDGELAETWFCEVFCCECRNCFTLKCANKFPPPCRTVPDTICLATPHYSQLPTTEIAGGPGWVCGDTIVAHCGGEVPSEWDVPNVVEPARHDIPFAHLSHIPGGCGWTGFICPDDVEPSHCDSYVLVLGDPTVTLTVQAFGDSGSAVYMIALADWNCDDDNEMTKTSDTTGLGGPYAASVTVTPSKGLIDQNGGFVVDPATGKPILDPPDHDSCDPNTPPCSCCWITGGASGEGSEDLPYKWYPISGVGDGELAPCDNSICNSVVDQLPDPGGLTLHTTLCGHVTEGTFTSD
jgi:hypothetical protein